MTVYQDKSKHKISQISLCHRQNTFKIQDRKGIYRRREKENYRNYLDFTLLHVINSIVGLLCSKIQTEELTFARFYTLIDKLVKIEYTGYTNTSVKFMYSFWKLNMAK